PKLADKNWLYPSPEELKTWYKKGKTECEEYLASNKQTFGNNHVPIYSSAYQLPPRGSDKCRGRDSLYTLTGMIVWPFGPMNECPTYSKCWFGFLTCGTPKMDNIHDISKEHIMKLANSEHNVKLPVPPEMNIT